MTGDKDQDSPNLHPEMSPGRFDAAATGEYTPRQCLVYGPTQDGPGSSTIKSPLYSILTGVHLSWALQQTLNFKIEVRLFLLIDDCFYYL